MIFGSVSALLYVFHWYIIYNTCIYIVLIFLVNVILLWWEYFTLKIRLDNTVEAKTLSADACNEHTFFILAILYTIFSVN